MAKNKMKELVDAVHAVETAHILKDAVDAPNVLTVPGITNEMLSVGKSAPIVFADLPLISKLPRPVMDRAKELLEELDSIKQINKMNEEREKELEEELEGIQRENELVGLRWGPMCFVWRIMAGRKTLSAEKLIENGVSAEVIERSKVTGNNYARREFRNLGVLGRGTGPAQIE